MEVTKLYVDFLASLCYFEILFSQNKTLVLSIPREQPIKINQIHFSTLKYQAVKHYFISKAG